MPRFQGGDIVSMVTLGLWMDAQNNTLYLRSEMSLNYQVIMGLYGVVGVSILAMKSSLYLMKKTS